ncbi:SurA N-terminal domain-containing protein [Candidatus Gottesmanbacteria bacterium]|nr:SurA N-terminal domain-containing protein [Candidatus Gottesmanbacteria bacterium]
MARKKQKIALPPQESFVPPYPEPILPNQSTGFLQKYRLFILGFLILALIGLFVTNKGLLLAAIVNGKPVFRWDLNRVLVSRFGQQTLENMISEELIADAAKKAGVAVSQAEIDAKEKELVDSLGGNVKIEDLLKYQGMTKNDFDDQIRLQLTVQKVLGKDIVISENDIDNFIATSSAMLRATDPAGLKEEARQAILDKKIGEKLQPWFLELKQKANILKFL